MNQTALRRRRPRHESRQPIGDIRMRPVTTVNVV
jgi:hypothetical protein